MKITDAVAEFETILLKAICKALCKSGKFETGEGTCALVCMDQLGNARADCSHRDYVHDKLAKQILEAFKG